MLEQGRCYQQQQLFATISLAATKLDCVERLVKYKAVEDDIATKFVNKKVQTEKILNRTN